MITERTPPTEHTIAASTQGRYLISCPTSQGPHPLLVGFHGYGAHAETHLAELQRLPGSLQPSKACTGSTVRNNNWLVQAG